MALEARVADSGRLRHRPVRVRAQGHGGPTIRGQVIRKPVRKSFVLGAVG